MEGVAPVTPPITKKQTTRRQVERPTGRPQPTKHKRTKVTDLQQSLCSARNSLPKTHGRHNTMRGIIGASWLVGGQRRAGKTTSSVVILLNRVISFHIQEDQMQARVRGRWLPVSISDFERGRKRPEESDWYLGLLQWYCVGGIQLYVVFLCLLFCGCRTVKGEVTGPPHNITLNRRIAF